jgi:hypothetical protein
MSTPVLALGDHRDLRRHHGAAHYAVIVRTGLALANAARA